MLTSKRFIQVIDWRVIEQGENKMVTTHLCIWLKILEGAKSLEERDFAIRGLERAFEKLPEGEKEQAKKLIPTMQYLQ